MADAIDLGAYEGKLYQTTTANDLTKNYGDADTLPAMASSTLTAFTYTSAYDTVATGTTDNKLHIIEVGTSIIKVNQEGNSEYFAAPEVHFTLTVEPKAITAELTGTVSK